METLQLGKLAIQETESGLRFAATGGNALRSEVPTADIPLLIDFLKRHLEDSANRRSAFRLDMSKLAPWDYARIEVAMHKNNAPVPCRVLDISLTGILLEMTAACDTPELGEELPLDIHFEGRSTRLLGRVVRRQDSQYRLALHFPQCIDADGEVDPPDDFAELFAELESLWLDSQLGLEWNTN